MTDAPARSRPLSPHLTIYRPQFTSVLSIFNRITGVGLLLAAMLIVWWFLAAATGIEAFARADGVLTSWIGAVILVLSLVALAFHFANGIRHLGWDAGFGFELAAARKSAIGVGIATVVLTLVVLVFAF